MTNSPAPGGPAVARTETAKKSPVSPEDACAVAFARLHKQLTQVNATVLASIPPMSPEAIDADGGYFASRTAAVAVVLDYVLDASARGAGDWRPIPRALVDHAHRAARAGMRPGVLVRHYEAGRRRFAALIRQAVEDIGYDNWDAARNYLRDRYTPLTDHILSALEQEHEWAAHQIAWFPEHRRKSLLVRRLLVEDLAPGELKNLGYDVHRCSHIGIAASGAEAIEALHRLKAIIGRQMLYAPSDDKSVWFGWLSGDNQASSIVTLKALLRTHGYSVELSLATGDARYGLPGWRQTHEEALLALPIAERLHQAVRCADVLPLLAAGQNKTIISAYNRTYLLPLNRLPRNGQPAREALRAYFKHERVATSAGAAAYLSRKTIENYVHQVRDLFPNLDLTALELALRLEELGYMND